MLSPSTKAHESSPINFSPIKKASASPFGFFWIAYDISNPKLLPLSSNSLNTNISLGVEIISISLIPANINTDKG